MFTNCSLRQSIGAIQSRESLIFLALPIGIEPMTCGLGSLFQYSEAFTSDRKSPPPRRVTTVVLSSTQRQSLVNVHSIVHFEGDIHCDRIQGPRPVTVVPDGNPRALVISQPAVPKLFRQGASSSAKTWQLSVTIFVRQWSNTHVSRFGCPLRRSRNSTPWPVFAVELVVKSSGRPLTFTSSIDFQHPNLPPSREVDADPVGYW